VPKGIPHAIPRSPPSSLAELQIYLRYKKQTEHIVVELPRQISLKEEEEKKVTQEILESWPREENSAQQ